ncbi:hypothetical protein BMJ25_12920 [Sinorhizobium medicae]|nr:hypothetical protein BMJ25_12920 [Sinorhizobium medicae]
MASACEITHAFKKEWTLPPLHAVLALKGLVWRMNGARRARRPRLIRLAAAVAISASAITVPVAVLPAAAPI